MHKLKIAALALVMGTVATSLQAKDYAVIAAEDIRWGLLNPLRGEASPKAADLWGDRTKNKATGMLVKFNKGFSSPPHIHNITYRGIVIEGLMHNDDPGAHKMWLPVGSFWTQPAGESHITAADGQSNTIYLEIDSGPYLVQPPENAFDNGERPINTAARNLVWLDAEDVSRLGENKVKLAYLWGAPDAANGSFVKLPAGFKGSITNDQGLKAVVITGKATHQWQNKDTPVLLSPGSFFSSEGVGEHHVEAEVETMLYINSTNRYYIK